MFAAVDEEQQNAKSAVIQQHLDALRKLSFEATSNDVRDLVAVSELPAGNLHDADLMTLTNLRLHGSVLVHAGTHRHRQS